MINWRLRRNTSSHKYSQLIFDKGAKTTHGEKIASSTNGARTTGHPHAKKKKKKNLATDLTLFKKLIQN